MYRKYTVMLLGLLFLSASAWAVDERVQEIRDGNRQFDKARYRKAELEYRRALVKDSTSVDASYNLANTLYRMEDYEQAMKVMQGVSKGADESQYKGDFNYNMGNVCVARKDWGQAVEAYKKALLENPGDVNAKEKANGLTPLMLAALENENGSVITALLEEGADISIKSNAGMTAYEYAVKNESPISKMDIVQELEP